MKTCSKCGESKELAAFNKRYDRKCGYRSLCRSCENKLSNEYLKTKDGVVATIYGSQKSNSKTRGHRLPEYTKQELYDWLFSQQLFHELYDEWKQSGYKKRLKPSVNRIHDKLHYCMRNIELMTWGENEDLGNSDMKLGRNNKKSKKVMQYDLGGNYITSHYSAAQASRNTGVNRQNISACCIGKRKSTGGFKWSHADES